MPQEIKANAQRKAKQMAEPMLKFISKNQEMPAKRPADVRANDFLEIYGEFILQKAEEQASRCSQCGVPFCQSACPLQNNIPDWLKLAATGRLEEAYQISSQTNPLPEICGRICPQDRLCEGNCVIEQSTHGAVTIGAIERFITETAFANNWVAPLKAAKQKPQSVGIIGLGPAGIAAAQRLLADGYKVTIYDRYNRGGGLLVYGIPSFKLEKDAVLRRIDELTAAGAEIKYNTDIGKNLAFSEVQKSHDAILIATGVYKPRSLGKDGDNVIEALAYLTSSNKIGFGDKVAEFDNGLHNAKGKDVVVVGGGDTAMDCVRTAIRQGAKSVTCLYRRDKKNMPGSLREVQNAEDEGVVFNWLCAPKRIIAGGVEIVRMRLKEAGLDGRQEIEEIESSGETIKADMVIAALGFEPEELPKLFNVPELQTTKWGTIKADSRNGKTSIDGVFAAGDIVRGASLVVWALKDGIEAAEHIQKYIQNKQDNSNIEAA